MNYSTDKITPHTMSISAKILHALRVTVYEVIKQCLSVE